MKRIKKTSHNGRIWGAIPCLGLAPYGGKELPLNTQKQFTIPFFEGATARTVPNWWGFHNTAMRFFRTIHQKIADLPNSPLICSIEVDKSSFGGMGKR